MGFFLFFGLIRGPLYALAGVDNEFHPLDEVIGVPMTILSNVYVNAPESLDPDIVAYMEDVAPYDTYKNYNTVGDWNDIKGHIGYIYTDRPYSLAEVFSFAVRAWQAEPDLAAEALSYLWQMPLWPVSDAYWRMSPYCEPLEGLSTTGIPFFRRILGWVCRLTAEPVLSWLFWLPGFTMLVLTITCSIIGPSRPKLALLLAAGLLPYHLATSMFLSSSTDYRFYLGLQIAAPLCLISLLFSSGTTYAAKSIQPSNEG
ncbi:MAG: hypothetical protein IJ242_15720 [Clostridia bacterium]|nr:hypothetical protein [Clostridia bacterium]